MIEINVTSDLKEMQRDLQAIRSRLPSLTAQAVNALASWARQETIDQTAKELRLPKARISTATREGARVPRFRLTRASPALPIARLSVLSAGIQVTEVAGAWTGRKPGQGGGVKAQGGRFYKGAFKGKAKGGKVRVWKRQGDERLPVFLPRIGTRKAMEKTFAQYVDGPKGVAFFRRKFDELAKRALAKAGVR